MKKPGIFVFVLSMVMACASASFAVEFSADMTTRAEGETMKGKFYISGTNTRVETGESIVIYRQDKGVMWVLEPSEKVYFEMPIDMSDAPRTSGRMEGEIERKLLGEETVNGYRTNKYRVTVKEGGSVESVYQWVAPDLDFPIKAEAVDGSWSTEYSNIRKSAPASLFEVPPGYEKMSVPGMRGF